MESRNRVATELVDEAIDFADELGLEVHHADNDAVVVDFGVRAAGGLEAGLLLTEIATGGLATVQTGMTDVGAAAVPSIELSTDRPALALQAAQLTEWPLEGFDGVGYGPANLFLEGGGPGGYEEDFDFAVLAVRGPTLPDEAVAADVAAAAGVPTSGVFLPTAPAASLPGVVAAVAGAAGRVVVRLASLGYDPESVITASGSAPLPPIPDDEAAAGDHALASISAGGRAHLVVAEDADALGTLPAGSAEPPLPARITIDVEGGPTYRYGEVDGNALEPLFGT